MGASWQQETAAGMCDGEGETLTWGSGACPTDGATGTCTLSVMGYTVVKYYYTDAENSKMGCDVAGGTWAAL